MKRKKEIADTPVRLYRRTRDRLKLIAKQRRQDMIVVADELVFAVKVGKPRKAKSTEGNVGGTDAALQSSVDPTGTPH